MFVKIAISIFLLATTVCAEQRQPIEDILMQQRNFMRLMMTTYSDRATTVDVDACFNYYMNEQEEIVDRYSAEHKFCITTADDAKRELSRQNDEKRESVLTRTHAVCSDLQACESLEDGLEFFECSYIASDENYGVLYGVSLDSKERVNELKIRYQQIDYEQDLCTTKAHNVYMNELDTSNKNLQKCLSGQGLPSSSTSAPTTTTTTPATTTTTVSTSTTPEAQTTEPMPEEDLGFDEARTKLRMAAMQMIRPL